MTGNPDPLGDLLRTVARNGGFSHLSLVCNGGEFTAAFRGVDDRMFRTASDRDPVKACLAAISGAAAQTAKCKKPSFENLLG